MAMASVYRCERLKAAIAARRRGIRNLEAKQGTDSIACRQHTAFHDLAQAIDFKTHVLWTETTF